jgi:hypothetical protein
MKNNFLTFYKIVIVLIILLFVTTVIFPGNNKSGDGKKNQNNVSLIAGDSYRLFINNIDLPLSRYGVLGDVTVPDLINGGTTSQGRINGINFLYSGGFYLSGKTNGVLWANAVATSSRIQDYVPGTVANGPNDPNAQLYVVKSSDPDFGQSWQDWKKAVALGANFYDGDGDGIYNPVDKHGTGKWEPDEDRPDLLGDETVWCVYNDGLAPSLRTFKNVGPQGIEIRQTVFAFNTKGVVGNMIFIRYSILNTGEVADVLDSCYFGAWADPDIGNPLDDLVGCDTTINSGFAYNNGPDNSFGTNPPSFLIDFFQGPVSYVAGETFIDNNHNGVYDPGIDTPIDTAYNIEGQVRGIQIYPGAKNVGLSSFVHFMTDNPTLGDPSSKNDARNYMLGTDKNGNALNPCTWTLGSVKGGVNCALVDNKFWYSGDPVTQIGWINNTPADQRQMSNTGPFKLEKGKPVDIYIAYVVGRGTDAYNSITVAKSYAKTAQIVFNNNFPSPPPPPPVVATVQTGDGYITLQWDTYQHIPYEGIDTIMNLDRKFQGYYVTAYRTNSNQPTVAGQTNAVEIANFELNNFIKSIYAKLPNGNLELLRPEASSNNKLDSALYADPTQGRIKIVINQDPFTGGPLIKGHEYYFVVTQYYLNHKSIVDSTTKVYGPTGSYIDLSGGLALDQYDTPILTAVYGQDEYSPFTLNNKGQLSGAYADGAVTYLVVNKDQLTGDQYKVEFFKDNSALPTDSYLPFWRLTDITKNKVLIDSSKNYDYDTTKYVGKVVDGMIVKVKPITPAFGNSISQIQYLPSANIWYSRFSDTLATGVYYVGQDIPQGSGLNLPRIYLPRSNVISADGLRRVELRFGTNGKAYRYLNGFIGNPVQRISSFVYAEGITAADTVNGSVNQLRGPIGKFGQGFVDVPFTAWVNDSLLNEHRQLAVGFIECSKFLGGNPDGNWDPGTSILNSYEAIIIFDDDYDPTGSQFEYTGKYTGSTTWADISKGFTIPAGSGTAAQIKIAKSPWFNALYVLCLQKNNASTFYQNGDKFAIPVTTYPYSNSTLYTFTTSLGGALSQDQQKDLFKKVNVFPNPLFAYNPATSYNPNASPDEPFVTFSNLPTEVTVKIFSLSGMLLRTLTTADKSSPTSPFLKWDLLNKDGLRVASGMYFAIVSAPGFGEKILKFAIIMPQKQIKYY